VAEDAKGDLVTFEHSQKLIYLIERWGKVPEVMWSHG
jgi:hypothetical protein